MNKISIAIFDALDPVSPREPMRIVQGIKGKIRGLYGQRVHRVRQTCDVLTRLGLITRRYNMGRVPAYRRLPMAREAWIKALEERKCQ